MLHISLRLLLNWVFFMPGAKITSSNLRPREPQVSDPQSKKWLRLCPGAKRKFLTEVRTERPWQPRGEKQPQTRLSEACGLGFRGMARVVTGRGAQGWNKGAELR